MTYFSTREYITTANLARRIYSLLSASSLTRRNMSYLMTRGPMLLDNRKVIAELLDTLSTDGYLQRYDSLGNPVDYAGRGGWERCTYTITPKGEELLDHLFAWFKHEEKGVQLMAELFPADPMQRTA